MKVTNAHDQRTCETIIKEGKIISSNSYYCGDRIVENIIVDYRSNTFILSKTHGKWSDVVLCI